VDCRTIASPKINVVQGGIADPAFPIFKVGGVSDPALQKPKWRFARTGEAPLNMEPSIGLEPMTHALRKHCSTN
jgi:hypothetical protein